MKITKKELHSDKIVYNMITDMAKYDGTMFTILQNSSDNQEIEIEFLINKHEVNFSNFIQRLHDNTEQYITRKVLEMFKGTKDKLNDIVNDGQDIAYDIQTGLKILRDNLDDKIVDYIRRKL